MTIGIRPYTVHEADVGFFAGWRDGHRVTGPGTRHGRAGLIDEFRAGLEIRQVRGDDGGQGGFGEWRLHGGDAEPGQDGWIVTMSLPLEAVEDGGAQVSSWPDAGSPLVVVVRFLDKETGWWRIFQFHDAVLLPVDAGEQSELMMRQVSVSAGWMEERYHGAAVPELEPVVRGVIEWCHAGRRVRCHEYDADADTFTEAAENVFSALVEGVATPVRYVTLNFAGVGDDESFSLDYLAANTGEVQKAGGVPGYGIGWTDARVMEISASSGLTLWPGWVLETEGAAEPLAMPESGRHWEHPKVVFRVLGRVYASVSHGVVAMPSLTTGFPEGMLDVPLRMGRLLLLAEGGYILPVAWRAG